PLLAFERPPTQSEKVAARAGVAAFLEVRPGLVSELPRGTAGSRGWPSPRSWEMVATLLAACEACRASEDARAMLITGAVGEGASLEFLSWLEHLDLPDPGLVLANPSAFELPDRSDRAYAVLTAVAAVAVARGDADGWAAAWEVVAIAAAAAPDVATLVARTLATHRPAGAQIPTTLVHLQPVLRAAGLLE
ncbi:MAG: AAA family ATPase, partial [Actinomycetota bacterium]|nr:AAA family ATPase [Actinomycetota bacterium]